MGIDSEGSDRENLMGNIPPSDIESSLWARYHSFLRYLDSSLILSNTVAASRAMTQLRDEITFEMTPEQFAARFVELMS